MLTDTSRDFREATKRKNVKKPWKIEWRLPTSLHKENRQWNEWHSRFKTEKERDDVYNHLVYAFKGKSVFKYRKVDPERKSK